MEMGSANARVLIPHLPFPSSSSHDPSTNPNPKPSKPLSFSDHYRLPTRRLLLFSLPLLTPSDSTEILPCEFFCEREASAAIFPGVSEPVELLDRGRELQPLGDFNQTLLCFTVEKSHHKYLSELQFQQMEKDAGSDVLSFTQNAIADRPSRKCFQQTEWAINHVPCPCLSKSHVQAVIWHWRLDPHIINGCDSASGSLNLICFNDLTMYPNRFCRLYNVKQKKKTNGRPHQSCEGYNIIITPYSFLLSSTHLDLRSLSRTLAFVLVIALH